MNKRLNVKDLINVGLFSILILLFTFVGGMLGFIPVLMPMVPFVAGFLSGPVAMLFAAKIRKPGMLFIQQILTALVFVATGHGIWMIPTALLGGLLGEYVLKSGGYKSIERARLAFVVAVISGVGNWIPIFIAREKYIEQLVQQGYGRAYAEKMMSVLPVWSLGPIVLGGMMGTYLGCTLGIRILKKHFVKAGMVKEE
ncbi:MptD family putative ECF transporter S component [Suipraeoptans intestinalis]|uniref:MptD family putative ECF transporter S component n=1 Tax=Suipraeoptans intestinalis TaxID=2606628 RepID=UPI0023F440A4|nr:MptD family putative ECF transporter S component [Suipraeoptans intestinalis]MDD7771042.1 MptD family putative ECF transporter S component [Suipraeoptans intestinalis]MDY3121422.1 MptD family putative ECF transporter S component [Suipraeoptans intestinalis]